VGYAPLCIGTTTSMRLERFTRPLMERYGPRLIIGKGGMGPQTLAAFQEFGGAYLAVVGGAAALRPRGSRRSRMSISTTCTPKVFGALRIKIRAADGGDGFPRRLALCACPGPGAARRNDILAGLGASE